MRTLLLTLTTATFAVAACGSDAGSGPPLIDGGARRDVGAAPHDATADRVDAGVRARDASPDAMDAVVATSIFMCDAGRRVAPECDAAADAGTVISIVSGDLHSCALFSGGTVECWGDNEMGELGVGEGCLDSSSLPLRVPRLCGVMQLAAQAAHTCALLQDGTVACWGSTADSIANGTLPLAVDAGGDGQCGENANTGLPTLVGSTAGIVPCLGGAVAVAAGGLIDCAEIAGGTVECWGFASGGGLGDGTGLTGPYLGQVGPVPVSNITNAVGIAASESGCALLGDMTVECWGPNESGQLGNGTTDASAVPVRVEGLSGVVAVTASSLYACATLSDGTVQCWGGDAWGQLGDGTVKTTPTTTPGPVLNLTDVATVVAGPGHVFAALADGTAVGWGSNQCGVFGGGPFDAATQPVPIPMLDHVTSVSSGDCHACALLADGGVECWGDNSYGQLGNGEPVSGGSLTPVRVKL